MTLVASTSRPRVPGRNPTRFLPLVTLLCTAACSQQDAAPDPHAQAQGPNYVVQATLQDVMDAIVDPAADDIWDAVATTVTRMGTEERQPRTAQEWQAVRRRVISLVESTNLLVLPGRKVTRGFVPSEGPGVLDSQGVQARIDAARPAFDAYAANLRQAALDALQAADARNADALLRAGGNIDAACEQCHRAFWYPGQKIPVPRPHSAATAVR